MTLYEIGLQYEESAKPIRAKLRELRGMLKVSTDPEEIWQIKRRIHELTPMLTECNKLSNYCKRYYEKGFYIGNGAFDRYERIGHRSAEQAAASDHPTHIDKRVITCTASSSAGMSVEQENIRRLSKRTRRVQNNCFKELLQRFEETS